MRKPWGMSAVLGIASLAIPGSASAQQPPFDSAIDVQTFEYAIGPKTFFTVNDADVADEEAARGRRAGHVPDQAVHGLQRTIRACPTSSGPSARVVVKSLTAVQLTAAYGVNDKLQIGANLPVDLRARRATASMPTTGTRDAATALNVTGLGDLLVEGKYRLYRKNALKHRRASAA